MARIKICGLSREADVEYVNEAGPDYAGFVFAPSRRQVRAEQAERLRSRLADGVVPVGVFVDAPLAEIRALVADGVVDLAQLHGHEDEDFVAELRGHGVPVIKAVRVSGEESVARGAETSAEYPLFDNGTGGTGKSFDWGLLSGVRRPYFLAGGVGLGNIERAKALCPFAIDVSSGAEVDGVKDRDAVRALVRAAHADGASDVVGVADGDGADAAGGACGVGCRVDGIGRSGGGGVGGVDGVLDGTGGGRGDSGADARQDVGKESV